MSERQSAAFWLIQGPGWLLVTYLVYAQAIPAFDYELGVRMGTQEPAGQITEVGTAFWYGFARRDKASSADPAFTRRPRRISRGPP